MLTTRYVPGAPNWIDLGTPDVEAATAFYGAVFGWEFRSAGPGTGGYGFFLLEGRTVAAAGPLTADGASSAWTLYFHSAHADATAKAVEQAGGAVRFGPRDIFTAGRQAGFTDPGGAEFAVWQPGDIQGLEAVQVPNTLWWTQLYATDVTAAKDFYRAVFAWDTADVVLVRGAEYTVVSPSGGGRLGAHGGIMAPPADEESAAQQGGASILGWHPYFEVSDCDAAVATAVERGATVVFPAETAAGIGRQATLRDPFQALFSVNQSDAV
ncbi:VOC family protein [Streptomyces lunaelactis]|uniref:VOC family protein n=1 Tax=Streptomyces lunaelactis TaxID=1535768 RepID=UPI001584520A|nr:VOC family protein [Streptomyces lunaelactis]NUL06391.1 VOC family protein [Streptomyces lunaelactis]